MKVDISKKKDNVVSLTLRMILHKDDNRKKILEELSEISKFYRIPNKKNIKTIPAIDALLIFIENKEGYITTIPVFKKAISEYVVK